jgi:hypothetical protein
MVLFSYMLFSMLVQGIYVRIFLIVQFATYIFKELTINKNRNHNPVARFPPTTHKKMANKKISHKETNL